MTTKICTLGHSVGALQQLSRALTPDLKRKLFKTTADIAYLDTGLAGAVQQLQWLARNETAIRAALAAVEQARTEKGART